MELLVNMMLHTVPCEGHIQIPRKDSNVLSHMGGALKPHVGCSDVLSHTRDTSIPRMGSDVLSHLRGTRMFGPTW